MVQGREADADRLTGLHTRKEIEDRFEHALDNAQENGALLSLVFLDIDHFKNVNDVHGHEVGDVVIKRVADIIRDAVNGEGVAGRYGGEEFVVLLPDTEREQAFLIAEKLRAAMDTVQVFNAGESPVKMKVTVSAGVSAYPTDGRTARDVLRKADQALYRAKETGRNKVCIAEEERMAAKTTHFTLTQLERLSRLSKEEGVGEAVLLREALDDLLTKYKVCDIES